MVTLKSNRGAALIICMVIIIMVTIYLAGYIIWGNFDLVNMQRAEFTERAEGLARAGLNRAIAEFSAKSMPWTDNVFPSTPPTQVTGCFNSPGSCPNPSDPGHFYTLSTYNDAQLPPPPLPAGAVNFGNYTVQVKYLPTVATCTTGCTFYTDRVWLHSIGSVMFRTQNVTRELDEVLKK